MDELLLGQDVIVTDLTQGEVAVSNGIVASPQRPKRKSTKKKKTTKEAPVQEREIAIKPIRPFLPVAPRVQSPHLFTPAQLQLLQQQMSDVRQFYITMI